MSSRRFLAALFIVAAFFVSEARAQGVLVQGGAATSGHLLMYFSPTLVGDAGGPQVPGGSPQNNVNPGSLPTGVGFVNPGQALALWSGYAGSPYNEIKLGFGSDGNPLLSIDRVGGGTPPTFNCNVNGTVFACLTPLGSSMNVLGSNAVLPDARTNLGLGTANSPAFAGVALGGATLGTDALAVTGSAHLSTGGQTLNFTSTGIGIDIPATVPLDVFGATKLRGAVSVTLSGGGTVVASIDAAGNIVTNATTASTSTTTGAIIDAGGLGVAGALNVGGTGTFSGTHSSSTTLTNGLYVHGSWTGSVTSGGAAFNAINVDNDTVNTTGAGGPGGADDLFVGHTMNSASLTGGRTALAAFLNLTAATGNGAANSNFYVALGAEMRASANDGGTNVAGAGNMTGSNPVVHLLNGATYFNGVNGEEVDVGVQTGATKVYYKSGFKVVQLADDAIQGTAGDYGIGLNNQASGTAPGWKTGLAFGGQEGWWPISSTGTMIGTLAATIGGGPSIAAAHGIDFSAVTFSSDAFKSTGFLVDPTGITTVAGVKLGSSLLVSQTAPTIASGGCTTGSAQSISHSNGTAAFEITLGGATCGSTITLTMPAAANNWVCDAHDITTPAGNVLDMTGAASTTVVVLTNFVRTTGVAGNFTGADKLAVKCTPY